jgi:glutathione S-transferase
MSEEGTSMSPTTLELWQTEWCPASHRVRQRLTELGLAYVVRQVPVEREDRVELVHSTGHESIPVLVAAGEVLAGEDAIVTHLNTHFPEPPHAAQQRTKAAKAKRTELEKACLELSAATH